MYDTLEADRRLLVGSSDTGQNSGQAHEPPESTMPEPQPVDTIHIHYFPDAIVICKEGEDRPQRDTTIETTLVESRQPPVFIAYAICVFYLLLILSCIVFQVYAILNPPIATVTIVPKSQTVTLTGRLQLGRLLHPLTISQSQTVPTTGKGHQIAKAATGTVTFYNGQQTAQTVAQGTVFTGSDGVSIETTQSATIPPGNPNTGYGTVTVTAQAVEAGSNGNIRAGDVNTPIALAVFVKSNQFTGGQNARDFPTVSQQDMNTVSTPLTTSIAQSMQAAVQGQRTPQEQLFMLPCRTTVTSDHHIGQEAPTVTVSVSETCSAVAYNSQELERKASDLLNHQALTRVGTAYSLFGNLHVRVINAATTHTPHPLVFVTFQASGTWVYALAQRTQQQIQMRIAGKTKQEALKLLTSLSGIEQASIHWEGFGDDTKLPKNRRLIHITLFIV